MSIPQTNPYINIPTFILLKHDNISHNSNESVVLAIDDNKTNTPTNSILVNAPVVKRKYSSLAATTFIAFFPPYIFNSNSTASK